VNLNLNSRPHIYIQHNSQLMQKELHIMCRTGNPINQFANSWVSKKLLMPCVFIGTLTSFQQLKIVICLHLLSLIYACMHACILNQMKQPSRYKSLNNQWSKKLAGHGLVQWIFHLCTWGQRSWWHAHSSDFLFHTCPLNNLLEYVTDSFPPLMINIGAKITIKPTFENIIM